MASRKKAGKKKSHAAGVRSSAVVQARMSIELMKRLVAMTRADWFKQLFAQHLNIICLMPKTGPDTLPTLSRGRGDTVAWKNHDAIAHTVRFVGACPLKDFTGVTLNPGENSSAYQVKPDSTIKLYTYVVEPPFEGPPGEPQIDVGG